jgi:hypothetical protein
MKILLTLLLFSVNAFALDWWDLEANQKYKITQDFQLPQTERSGSLLDVSVGDEVVFKYKVGIPGLNTQIFVFDYLACPGPQMETDLKYFPVQGTSPVINVGVHVEPVCELNVFIETKDVFTKSFLE